MVDCWRNHLIHDCHDASHRLDGTGCTQQMASHALGGADVQVVGRIAKHLLNGFDFSDIAKWRRRSMDIDIVHIRWIQTRVIQCVLHHVARTKPFRMRSRNVMRICSHSASNHLTINFRSSSLGVL